MAFVSDLTSICPLRRALADAPLLVLDGALATELEVRGGKLTPPLWSANALVDAPELIYRVHLDYFRAGARCAVTASYQATPQGFLQARGFDERRSLELIRLSVRLAARARDERRREHPQGGELLVAGSVGPYGAYLANGAEYRGDYALSHAEMMDFHRPRIAALAEAGADVLASETQPSFREIRALAAVLAEFPRMSAWFAFTLRDSAHLSDGTPLREAVAQLDAVPQVAAVGVNCIAPEKVTAALTHLAGLTSLPLVAYPNAGGRYAAASGIWHPPAPGAGLASRLSQWRAAGARLVGGCCRTTPRDIAELARSVYGGDD